MKTLTIKLAMILFITCSLIYSNAFADKREIKFKNNKGKTVDDLHIVFDTSLVRDTLTGTFGNNVRHGAGTASYNFYGTEVGSGNTATQTFVRDSGDIKIKEWWWTKGGNAFKDGDMVGVKRTDNGGLILVWNGGPAAGNGVVLVAMGGQNGMFHTTQGYSASQTCASFIAFINNNFNNGVEDPIYVSQSAANRIYMAGNILGDPDYSLSVQMLQPDFNLQMLITPYAPSKLNITAMIEARCNALTSEMIGDYATVLIRNSTPPFSIKDQSVTWLDSTGKGQAFFYNAVNNVQYFLVVNHRNSIETWSSAPNRFISNQLSYDFTTSAAKAFGSNLTLVGTKYCNYSGDVNQDAVVDAVDLVNVYNDANNFVSGYTNTDLNGDEIVDVTDLVTDYNNAINFISVIRP